MKKTIIAAFCLVLFSCSSTMTLTEAERQKLDPQLMKLLSDNVVADADFDSSLRRDGTKEYGVIIRSKNVEEIKQAGVQVGSAFNDVITARVTIAELRKILSLPSVVAVQSSSKNKPQ